MCCDGIVLWVSPTICSIICLDSSLGRVPARVRSSVDANWRSGTFHPSLFYLFTQELFMTILSSQIFSRPSPPCSGLLYILSLDTCSLPSTNFSFTCSILSAVLYSNGIIPIINVACDSRNVFPTIILPVRVNIQGGSDKSGIFFFLLWNDTTQLKIIRFYWSKNKCA